MTDTNKKGMFDGLTAKDWIIGLFTGGLWILYKMYKNGAPMGKVGGAFLVLVVLVAIFGEDKKEIATTENVATQKSEAETCSSELSYKCFKLGMNKKDIPPQIKLVKADLMADYDQSYKYTDANNNLIKINDIDFTVTFIIRGDNNKVRGITYKANVDKDIDEDTLIRISKKFMSRQVENSTMKDWKSGKPSGITLVYLNEEAGINEDFRVVYMNKYSSFFKNTITIQHILTSKKGSKEQMDENFREIKKRLIDGTFLNR